MPNSVDTVDEYDFVEYRDAALDPEVVAELREWLHPTDYLANSGEFRRYLLSQAPGTGLWICQTQEYRKWHDSPHHGSLWVKGVPGAGKSVMAASLIQHLKVTENCPVLFFFFRNIVTANSTPRALIQDWLAQLLPYSLKLQFALETKRLKTSLEETTDDELIHLFLEGLSCVPKLYCIGDALDEMSTDNKPFLEKLYSLATHRPGTLKLLVTSRPKQDLQSSLRDSSIVHINLQQRLVNTDILAYLEHRFDTSSISQVKHQLKQDIVDMVARRSDGLFLYAKLAMDQLQECLESDSATDVAALATSLPIGLEQTYTRMLAKQRVESKVTKNVQLIVLEAITHASKPLRLNELASFLECVYPDLAQPNTFKALIATSCGPLIEILEDETLQVIRHSLTEFLRGNNRSGLADELYSFPTIDSLQAHRNMAINCLRYLQAGTMLLESEKCGDVPLDASKTYVSLEEAFHLQESPSEYPQRYRRSDPFNYSDARMLHPFLGYAVENWHYHAGFYDVADEHFFEAITSFANPHSLPFLRWLVIQWGTTSTYKGSIDGIPTLVHLAAFSGLCEFASRLLQENASLSALDAQRRTPLHWASANGHVKVASLLIKLGADPNPCDWSGSRPIHLAIIRGHTEVIKLLLKAGVSPDTAKTKADHPYLTRRESHYEEVSALTYASRAGNVDTVLALASFCDDRMLGDMLCLLCSWNKPDAALALLANSPVSPNATYKNITALCHSCRAPSLRCVEILVEKGADVDKMSRLHLKQQTRWATDMAPIHHLIQGWNDSNNAECRNILKVLLQAGAGIDQPNGVGRTALLEAADGPPGPDMRLGHCNPAVKALIEEGADINAVNPPEGPWGMECSGSVLHTVAQRSLDLEAIKLLVQRGCDLNEMNDMGQTVLSCALQCASLCQDELKIQAKALVKAIAEYLLDQGADPSCHDHEGESPLFCAMSLGSDVFKLLLSKCEDVVEKERCWFSLPELCRMERSEDNFTQCLEVFLADGFDIDKEDNNGKTLYLGCCGWMLHEAMEILRNLGANTNAKTRDGNNALLCYCLSRSPKANFKSLARLIAHGVSPLETNKDGNGVLHLIANTYNGKEERADLIRRLVDMGVSVNSINNEGSTPLHLYQERHEISHFRGEGKYHHFLDALNNNGGVDFEILDNKGLSPFHIAATKSEEEVAKLIGYGIDLNHLTSDGRNALHLACDACDPNMIGQLLMRGVNFDQQDNLGRTPLFYACSSGDAESVGWLLRYGASPHLKASNGETVLHACAHVQPGIGEKNAGNQDARQSRFQSPGQLQKGDADSLTSILPPWYCRNDNIQPPMSGNNKSPPNIRWIVESLIQAGVDVSCRNKRGETALDIALDRGIHAFVEIFYRSNKLLEQATKHLEAKEFFSQSIDTIRQRLRLQISLLLSRSYPSLLSDDDSTLKTLMERPGIAPGLLATSETIALINKSFETSPTSKQTRGLLCELMHPDSMQKMDHLGIIEGTSGLISYYSDFEGVKAGFTAILSERSSYSARHLATALGIACHHKQSNFLTVKMLVERLHVNLDAHFACISEGYRWDPLKIVPGGTALHILASVDTYWQLEAMRYLLTRGADANSIDDNGETPLHIVAVRREHGDQRLWRLEAVKVLLDYGADADILDNKGLSVLHKASTSPEIIKELLSREVSPDLGIKSPLFTCIHNGNVEALNLLLRYGADPNAIDKQCHKDEMDKQFHHTEMNLVSKKSRSVCPLLFCVFGRRETHRDRADKAITAALMVALVDHCADLYLPLNEDETLIHFLYEFSSQEFLEVLMTEPCISKIDFDRRDQQGRTVLMAACDWSRVVMEVSPTHPFFHSPYDVPLLEILNHGANASSVDKSGKTALHHLLSNRGYTDDLLIGFINHKKVSSILFQKDGEGYSPLHHALGVLRPAVCEALLEKGGDLLEPDPQGRTALHYIASQCLLQRREDTRLWTSRYDTGQDFFDGCISLWQKYLSLGGSINATDNAGDAPLHTYLSMLDPLKACKNSALCHVDHYEALFPEDSGVDVFAVNNAGETALHKIASRPHSGHLAEGHDKALFLMMVNNGLDPLKEDAKGRSSLDIARACDKEDIVALFSRK
ncbi:hypothetical protein FLONG3_6302 [Fusarium longipes]|uniref:Nephrocystin 3-like N-terminal domain-containing protein n=1 Tax=Fusarium longipes TaxID=694270 RepID=A0A395SNC9_9HYPO|nr:hypothetical protein FLONG3_6302 [Fusarium longipes]